MPDPNASSTNRRDGPLGECVHPAEPASAPVAAEPLVRPFLQDGETILLALKPSFWMVLFRAAPGVALAGLLAAALHVGADALGRGLSTRTIVLVAVAAVCLCGLWGLGHWLGRLYLLTDKRVLSVRGLRRVVLLHCPLHRLRHMELSRRPGERLLGTGTLTFESDRTDAEPVVWNHVARVRQVAAFVEDVIRKAQ